MSGRDTGSAPNNGASFDPELRALRQQRANPDPQRLIDTHQRVATAYSCVVRNTAQIKDQILTKQPSTIVTIIASLLFVAPPNLLKAQTANSPFHEDYVEVNGVRLHYASVGQGPLVLFLHGYPSFWYQWKDQMLEMGRDHLAVGLDMRGYNLSSKPEGLEPYRMKHLVEDVRQFALRIGDGRKFVLVAHDWGGSVAWVFAMAHPEMLDKLIIINAGHTFVLERELRDNAAQRYASDYVFGFVGNLAPGQRPPDETNTRESARRRAQSGFVDAAVKSGHYTEEDRQRWIDAWSQPGSTTAGLNYYRVNHRNAPFNDRHPVATEAWSAKELTESSGVKDTIIRIPTLVIWGMKDNALLTGNLSGLDKWVPNLSVKLYPDDDHWVMIEKYKEVAQDIRQFIENKNFPKDSVYREVSRR